MSTPVEPYHTTPETRHPVPGDASAPDDRHETLAESSQIRIGEVPHFGPPAAEGEVGVLGPYRLVKELGRGGMGAVYLALDTRLDRRLALKVMLPEFTADREAKARFLREARAAAMVAHDHVVTVYEADERDGIPYIAMQFLQGYPLDEYLRKKGLPPIRHVLRLGREAALGLAAAHELGLVHRDIKPANLWLEAPEGRVKVLDFGLAKPISAEVELTRSGTVMGTPTFMSPEQARGLKLDHRTDLFSLGAVLYRVCTGRSPFTGEHAMAVLAAVLTDEPTPIRELNPNVPEALATFIHRLLSKKPEDRPGTAAEVAHQLQAISEQLLSTPVAGAPADSAGAGVSASGPVVVQEESNPSPVVVPMLITTDVPESVPNLGGADGWDARAATEIGTTSTTPRSTGKTGAKARLIAACVAALVPAVAGVVVVSQRGKYGPVAAEENLKQDRTQTGQTPPLPPTYTNRLGVAFIKIPKGTAWLGGGTGRAGDTKVEIQEDFYLGKYAVTQEQWEKALTTPTPGRIMFTGWAPSYFSRNGVCKDSVKDLADAELKRFPVDYVSWDDCQMFVHRLNVQMNETGWVYRLPTEVEWEYACRGGPVDRADSAFDYYFAMPTNILQPDMENYSHGDKSLKRPCVVGMYEPNRLGLHDMHGNIGQWCQDELEDRGTPRRIYRGGTWYHTPGSCRAGYRNLDPTSKRLYFVGLRLARVPATPGGGRASTGTRAQALLHMQAGRWKQAAADYDTLVESSGADDHFWYELACLRLLAGDVEGHAKVRSLALARCSKDNFRPYLAARVCTLRAALKDDLDKATKLATEELEKHRAVRWAQTQRAALLVRAGVPDEATTLLRECLKDQPNWEGKVVPRLWLALALHAQGRTEEARQELDVVVSTLNGWEKLPPEQSGADALHVHDWLEAQVLRREAERLYGAKPE